MREIIDKIGKVFFPRKKTKDLASNFLNCSEKATQPNYSIIWDPNLMKTLYISFSLPTDFKQRKDNWPKYKWKFELSEFIKEVFISLKIYAGTYLQHT